MNNTLLLSIIVPVYNVEQYLERCIDSILNQTFSNFELILIDDGSKDNSSKICDRYASIDSRIVVMHKENGGISSARNAGLDIAKGDYIGFVDSDDYIDKNYYEVLINDVIKNNADLCVCNYIRHIKKNKFVDEFILKENWYKLINKIYNPGVCWLCVYLKRIIDDNSIRFISDRDITFEDVIFNMEYIEKAKTIYLSGNKTKYYYCYNQNSISRKYDINRFDKVIKTCNYYKQILVKYKKENVDIKVASMFWSAFEKCLNSTVRYKDVNYRKEIKRICENKETQEYLNTLVKNGLLNGLKKYLCLIVYRKKYTILYIALRFYNIIIHKELIKK